jgi:hypothetical protein
MSTAHEYRVDCSTTPNESEFCSSAVDLFYTMHLDLHFGDCPVGIIRVLSLGSCACVRIDDRPIGWSYFHFRTYVTCLAGNRLLLESPISVCTEISFSSPIPYVRKNPLFPYTENRYISVYGKMPFFRIRKFRILRAD